MLPRANSYRSAGGVWTFIQPYFSSQVVTRWCSITDVPLFGHKRNLYKLRRRTIVEKLKSPCKLQQWRFFDTGHLVPSMVTNRFHKSPHDRASVLESVQFKREREFNLKMKKISFFFVRVWFLFIEKKLQGILYGLEAPVWSLSFYW